MKLMLQVSSRHNVVYLTLSRADREQAAALVKKHERYRGGKAEVVLMKPPYPQLGRHYQI